jgi:transcriptional regulator with XRE-family HTH domain
MVNIGEIIREYCKTGPTSVYDLAKQIRITPTTLYRSLRTNSLTIARLHQISQALNHNFFIHFIENTNSPEEQLLKLTTENKELTVKVASLQKEVAYLQEINSLLKIKNNLDV